MQDLEVIMHKKSKLVFFAKIRGEENWKKHDADIAQSEDTKIGVPDAESYAREKAFDVIEANSDDVVVDLLVARVFREGSVQRVKEVVTKDVTEET